MKITKVLMFLIIGILSLNLIYAGSIQKSFLIKGEFTIPNQGLGGQHPCDLGGAGDCKIFIYGPNSSTLNLAPDTFVSTVQNRYLDVAKIKSALSAGITTPVLNITSTAPTVDFTVKIMKGAPNYTTEVLSTVVKVPNPNAQGNKVLADYANEAYQADMATELQNPEDYLNTMYNTETLPECSLNTDRRVVQKDGQFYFCVGEQSEWLNLFEIQSLNVLNALNIDTTLEEPSSSLNVTPVLMRYWDTISNSWQIKWKRLDTYAMGPGGVIPMDDLNISNRMSAEDGSLLTWNQSANQMTWISKQELYDEIIDVGTDPNYQPILVPNKYASVKFKDGVSSDGVNYYMPIYRLPNLFTIGSVYSAKTRSVPRYFTKNITSPLFFTLNSENNQGSFEVKGYYKPTGATIATNVFTETINGSTLTLNGLNSYSRSVAVEWTPVISGNGQFYIEVKKTVAGTTNVARSSLYNVHIYEPITASTFIGGACANSWDCDWVYVGWGSFSHLYENNGAIITGINVVVTGGSGIYRYCATESGSTCDPTSLAGTNLGFRLPRLGYTDTGYSTVIGKVIVKDLRTNDTYILPQSVEMSCTSQSQTSEYC